MKRLLSVLLLVFAFSYMGYAADVTLDMFEYATDDSAQAAYVSSDIITSPISQWKMNDNLATTNVIDNVGSNTGTSVQNTDQLDTTGKINGALTFNGTTDYIDCGADASLNWGAGDGSVTAWFKTADLGIVQTILLKGRRYAGGKRYNIYVQANGYVAFNIDDNIDSKVVDGDTIDLDDNTWHFACGVRDGNNLRIYVDGSEDSTPTDITGILTLDDNGIFEIGAGNDATGLPATDVFFNGSLDDVRVYDFALTADEVSLIYNNDSGTEDKNPGNLQCHSESTIKQQGSYSLKGIAVITDSLNDTLTRTVDPTIDLTSKTQIKYDIYSASRTGSQIKIGIHDSGGTTTEHTANISSTGAWETQTWDISGVDDANKDDIESIIITVINADAANTFYIDNMYGAEAEPEVEHPTTDKLLIGGLYFQDGILKHSDFTRHKRGTAE